ncbi:hypothetical protein [uncultured Methylobacterium sp.]|uniref:hypothetical protein n=1 Tax=uncultured Methylobacterium sp. TaxID=157278 RepID=UPI00262E26E3|nr:hypothetical protein [uncultured Methylobacterium sp.]
MATRTPEEARAQIAFALEAKRHSLDAATEALRASPDDPMAQREVTRLRDDIGRLEIQLRGAEA